MKRKFRKFNFSKLFIECCSSIYKSKPDFGQSDSKSSSKISSLTIDIYLWVKIYDCYRLAQGQYDRTNNTTLYLHSICSIDFHYEPHMSGFFINARKTGIYYLSFWALRRRKTSFRNFTPGWRKFVFTIRKRGSVGFHSRFQFRNHPSSEL